MLLLDVVASEDDDIVAAHTTHTALAVSQPVHRKRHALGRQRTLHVHAYEFDDARGREELARLVTVGLAQVGEDKLFPSR